RSTSTASSVGRPSTESVLTLRTAPATPGSLPGLDLDQVLELAVAGRDVVRGGRLDPVHAEALDRERGADGAVQRRAAEGAVVDRARRREVTQESAGEAVARPGRIGDLVKRECWRPER